jgi:hypothetical protein
VGDAETLIEMAVTAATDTGLFALWNPSRFAHVTDYGSWDASIGKDEDIAGHARAGDLVPIGTGDDGSFGFVIRADSAKPVTLTERERQHLIASSKPYLFRCEGTAHLSGIEYVSAAPPPPTVTIGLAEGRYSVTAHLFDWVAGPGARDPSGTSAPDALPDIVVLVSPAPDGGSFRTSPRTFGTTA